MLVATGSIGRSMSIGSLLVQTPPYCTLTKHPPGKPIVRATGVLTTQSTGFGWKGKPDALAGLCIRSFPTKGRCTFADTWPWLL